jgi:hypothetical protein
MKPTELKDHQSEEKSVISAQWFYSFQWQPRKALLTGHFIKHDTKHNSKFRSTYNKIR